MKLDFDIEYKIKLVGDLHGSLTNFVRDIKDTKTLFFLSGDNNFGKIPFDEDLEKLFGLEYTLSKNDNYLLVIRGNHDNPKYFKKKSSFKNELSDNAEHIILIPDYSIVHIGVHSILCIGGARSVDRVDRIKDYSYWTAENVKKPEDSFYESLEKDGEKIDVVFSHAAPLFAYPLEFSNELKYYNSYLLNSWSLYDKDVKNDIYKERLLLKGIYEKLNNKNHIKYWIYGHYHKSIEQTYNKTKMISLGLKEIKDIEL